MRAISNERWFVKPITLYRTVAAEIIDQHGRHVADVIHSHNHMPEKWRNPEEGARAAALIAAAPDLLEVARLFMSAYNESDDEESEREWRDLPEYCRAAIDKAEWRAP